MTERFDAACFRCDNYEEKTVENALRSAIDAVGGFDWLRPGMSVALKANLVVAKPPEAAATTHPAVLASLTRLLRERGAGKITVGDSPSGLYTKAALRHIYKAAGLDKVCEAGAELNYNVGIREVSFQGAKTAKEFTCTSWLEEADAVIDVCKLKSHGMMGMTAAVKNMFGTIPGMMKPEYHFRYKNEMDFADMILDLNEYFHPVLAIADAVVGMEGNGPTMGTPRKIGVLVAGRTTYAADIACARLLDIDPDTVPTMRAAKLRSLGDIGSDGILITGDAADVVIDDFNRISSHAGIHFEGRGGVIGRMAGGLFGKVLETKPLPDRSECVSCGKCAAICPAGAIEMINKYPQINRRKCIRCFCCQEFCPAGAMKVHRSAAARLILH